MTKVMNMLSELKTDAWNYWLENLQDDNARKIYTKILVVIEELSMHVKTETELFPIAKEN